jgi:hypothetical protein
MLKALGTRTFNECFATDLATREIIGCVNKGRTAAQTIMVEHMAAAGAL